MASPPKESRSGVINYGYLYEVNIPAFLALEFLEQEDIKWFSFRLNQSSYGKFDDLVIQIDYKDRLSEKFAVQLKHRNPTKPIAKLTRELKHRNPKTTGKHKQNKEDKKFNIEIYLKALEKESPQNREIYKYILFTNAKFEEFDEKLQAQSQDVSSDFRKPLNHGRVHLLYSSFFLFHRQKNVHELEESIKDIFKDRFFSNETAASLYIDFFRGIRTGNYEDTEITRDSIILKLQKLLLQNCTITPLLSQDRNQKLELLEQAIRCFDITLLRDNYNTWNYSSSLSSQDDITELKKYKILKKDANLEEDEKRFLVLHYLRQSPMFIQINTESEKNILIIARLCHSLRDIKLKFVLVGPSLPKCEYEGLNIFSTLSDLGSTEIYDEILTTFQISLQGRSPISLKQLKDEYKVDLGQFITSDDMFKSLDSNICKGEELDSLPNPYIERHFQRTKFSHRLLVEICSQKITVIQCNGKSEGFKKILRDEETRLTIIDIATYKNDPQMYKTPLVVLTDETDYLTDCYHLILTIEGQNCLLDWVDQVDESNIFDSKISAVCDYSGVGKTTTMKFLALRCSLKYWVSVVQLRQIEESFLRRKPKLDEILERFLYNDDDKDIIKYFQEAIVFFMDGLDELMDKCVSGTIEIVKILLREGYRVWIFCSELLTNVLEKNLKVFSVFSLEPIEESDQRNYVRDKLEHAKMPKENIERLIKAIFEDNAAAYAKLLTIPLNLYILANILNNDDNIQNLSDNLTLTKMYDKFLDGKIKHHAKKSNSEDKQVDVSFRTYTSWYIRECKIAALRFCLDFDFFRSLHVSSDDLFLESIKKNGDCIGLIMKINNDNTVVFTHANFAQYFAALWLNENFDKVPEEKIKWLFKPRYAAIWYFFILKLAEGHPLHIAIINRDISAIESLMQDNYNDTDQKGRNCLHLASSMGKYHPKISRSSAQNELMKMKRETEITHQQILCRLINLPVEPLQLDNLLRWSSFQYAGDSMSLSCLEELFKKFPNEDYLHKCEDLFTLCYYSVTLGYINIFKKLIQVHGWTKVDDYQRQLPKPFLHLSLENGHTNIAKYLIEKDNDLTKTDVQGRTALHEAAYWNHLEVVELLLKKGFQVEARDITGKTPLHLAAKMGHRQVAKLLVRNEAHLNSIDNLNERQPIHKAAYTGRTSMIKYLVNEGVDANTPDKGRKTPLQRAAEMGHYDTVVFLVDKVRNLNTTDKNKRTPLHYAAVEGHSQIVKHLVDHKASVLVKDEDGKTPFDLAFARGHHRIAKILQDAEKDELERGSLPHCKENPLHAAAHENDLAAIKELLQSGKNIEETNEDKETILHIASNEGYEEIVSYLLEQNANIAASNIDGRVPLHLASIRGHSGIVKILLTKGESNTPDKYGISPLQKAAFKGHQAVVEAFLDAGVNVNEQSEEGGTALHSTARGGHIQLMDFLIKRGANVNIKTKSGKTCLHVAAHRGNPEIVRHILQKQKDIVNEVDGKGRTALHWAAEKGYKDVVEQLVAGGATLDIADFDNQTALAVATAIRGREEIVDYLESCFNSSSDAI